MVGIVDAENIASINLLKSIGFRQEGHFVENIFFKGKWGSEFQYAMLKREWDKVSAKFKDAPITYTSSVQIDAQDLHRWIQKAIVIQWDYKNIVKRKGVLERLK